MSDKDISLDEIKTLLREKQNKINDMEAMSVKSRKKLELINKKQYTEASEEIKNSKWYRQVPQRVEMLSRKLQDV